MTSTNPGKTMGIRLDETTFEKIEKLSKSMNLNKSNLLKTAFNEWALIRESIQLDNLILINKLLFSLIINEITEEKIKNIASIMSDHVLSLIKIRQIKLQEENDLKSFLDNFVRIASKERFGWFNSIGYTICENKVSIYGFHSLNSKYSTYIKELLKLILKKEYDLLITKDTLQVTENTIVLEFLFPEDKET